MPHPAHPEPEAGRPAVRIGRLILVLSALTAFAPLATDMYLASFSRLAAEFHTDSGSIQLGLSVFFVGMGAGQVFYGPLSDRYGRKGPLRVGIAIFVAASFLIVLAPNVETFIGLRLLQAIGGCAGGVVSRAIIRDLFDEHETARVLSLMMMVQGMAPVLAPILGGYILALAGWRAIFMFLTAFGAICFVLASTLLPETLPRGERRPAGIVGVLKVYGYLLYQWPFMIPALVGSFAGGGLFAFISGSSFVFMEIYGLSPQHYGWLFGLNASGMIVAAQANRFLLRRFSPTRILGGALCFEIAAIALALAATASGSLVLFLVPLLSGLATIPLVGANATAIAMVNSGKHAGSASAIIGVVQFGMAGAVSALVGALHDGTALPMVGGILCCALLAGGTLLVGRWSAQSNRMDQP